MFMLPYLQFIYEGRQYDNLTHYFSKNMYHVQVIIFFGSQLQLKVTLKYFAATNALLPLDYWLIQIKEV